MSGSFHTPFINRLTERCLHGTSLLQPGRSTRDIELFARARNAALTPGLVGESRPGKRVAWALHEAPAAVRRPQQAEREATRTPLQSALDISLPPYRERSQLRIDAKDGWRAPVPVER